MSVILDLILHLPLLIIDVCTDIDSVGRSKEIAEKPFICPNCGKEFHKKWNQLYFNAFDPRLTNKAILKCPHCKERDACRWSGVDRVGNFEM